MMMTTLPANEVHLWVVRMDRCQADEFGELDALLDAAELERARRFHFERDRRHFTIARGMLRALLGRCLGTPPCALRFAYTERGKPHLAAPITDLRFNLSHSGGYALIALTRGREVGVDVEAGERLGDDWSAIARRYFSARECAEIHSLPAARQRAGFLTGWARKEAYLKATGLGIAEGLQKIEVTLGPDRPPAFRTPAIAARWAFCNPDLGGESLPAAALVVERLQEDELALPVRCFSMLSVAAVLGHQDG